MYKIGNGAQWGIAVAILSLLALSTVWRSEEPHIAKDYEDCVEEAQSKTSSSVDYSKLVTQCGERFAGRRKPGGGYAYFDFMQNRTFDLVGPNPTDDERRQIDRAYMGFLATQRKETISSILARALADQEQATFARKDVGPPLVLTPKIPLPAKRPPKDRSKFCDDGSLSCSWAKLSAAARNGFATSAGTNH